MTSITIEVADYYGHKSLPIRGLSGKICATASLEDGSRQPWNGDPMFFKRLTVTSVVVPFDEWTNGPVYPIVLPGPADAVFARANGMTLERYRAWLTEQDD